MSAYQDAKNEQGPRGGKSSKQRLTRDDFKKDLVEAVQEGTKKMKIPKKKKKDLPKATKNGSYAGWNVAELRKFLNDKKTNLLKKSGFPDGRLPRSKASMIALCKKLKRKRW